MAKRAHPRCPWHDRYPCHCFECAACLAGDCDEHMTVEGRSIECVNEYASTCDLCGDLTSHDLMSMDRDTQLGYCRDCTPEAFRIGLLKVNIGNDFSDSAPAAPGTPAGDGGEE